MTRPDLVLLMAYSYPPCPEPGATRPSQFAKYLRRFGYNVRVITAWEQQPPRDEVIYVPTRQRVPDRRSVRGVTEMALRKVLFPCDEGMLWAADAAKAAGYVVRQYQKTAVFSTFPPINSHLAAWMLKRRFGVRWIADFRDPLAGSPSRELTNARLSYGAIPAAVDRLMQRGIFRDADALIANTDAVRDRWRLQYPWAAPKAINIWNGFDPEEILTAAPAPPRPHRVMAHTGSIYSGRHPGPLLECMERLIRNGRLDPKRFLLHLVGPVAWDLVPDREVFRRLTELGCLNATGQVLPQNQARQLMREAGYLLLLDVIVPGAGQQLPSKIFDNIPIGRPILAITTRNSPADRVLAGSGIPYACIYDSSPPEQADRALLGILSRPMEPAQPSEWFFSNFDAVQRSRALSALIDGEA